MLQTPPEESSVVRKDFFIIFVLLFNALTWWYITPIIVEDLLIALDVTESQTILIWTSYFAAIVASSIVGSILSTKIKRLSLLYAWIVSGMGISLLPALLSNSSAIHVMVVSVLFGVLFGLGMPSCLAFFADWTQVGNRGRIGGIVLLVTNLSAPLFAILFGMFDLVTSSVILAVWRGSGLLVFFLKPDARAEEKLVSDRKEIPSFATILQNRSFVLYFVAWLLFCLVDRFETPIQRGFLGDDYESLLMFGPILGSISAFVGGLLSDRIGRKRVLLYGFVSLGIAYAIIGIADYFFLAVPLMVWYLSFGVISVSAGFIWVLLILVLWGDLSQSGAREKYYAIGTIPFFLTNIIQLFSAEHVTLHPESAFSLAAFFLFLAVLPLLYAPETLPEKKIELRRLRKYFDGAKKISEKYT
ncbi:MAG: MFS transporter [Candidatus Bathyarchaeota archaeon]|nr:MAG: MFS transporter [Candidatus Bathyarchaeota archaeon]